MAGSPTNPGSSAGGRHWSYAIYEVFKAQRITLVSFVPDAGHMQLIELCQTDPHVQAVPLTTEEEGVALAAGAYLGGQAAAVLMPFNGVGDCLNLVALVKTRAVPFLPPDHHARRVGRIQPLASPDGPKHTCRARGQRGAGRA